MADSLSTSQMALGVIALCSKEVTELYKTTQDMRTCHGNWYDLEQQLESLVKGLDSARKAMDSDSDNHFSALANVLEQLTKYYKHFEDETGQLTSSTLACVPVDFLCAISKAVQDNKSFWSYQSFRPVFSQQKEMQLHATEVSLRRAMQFQEWNISRSTQSETDIPLTVSVHSISEQGIDLTEPSHVNKLISAGLEEQTHIQCQNEQAFPDQDREKLLSLYLWSLQSLQHTLELLSYYELARVTMVALVQFTEGQEESNGALQKRSIDDLHQNIRPTVAHGSASQC